MLETFAHFTPGHKFGSVVETVHLHFTFVPDPVSLPSITKKGKFPGVSPGSGAWAQLELSDA